jgi:RNA polymerase sigma factor (sigma-70 family)
MNENPARDRSDTSQHLRKARAGDQLSLAWVIDHFTPLLLQQASYRLPATLRTLHAPEDVVNDVWAAVLPRLPEIGPWDRGASRAFLGYLSMALLRRVRDLIEKHIVGKPKRAVPETGHSNVLSGLVIDTTGVVTRAARSELRVRIDDCLASLPERDRAIIVLRGIEQQRNQDVAALLGMAPNTVAVAFRRALQKLAPLLPERVMDAIDPGDD